MASQLGFSIAAPITPHDTDTQPPYESVLVASVAGGAAAVIRAPGAGSADVTFAGLLVGTVIPMKVKHVRATGTNATLVGLMR